MRSVRVTVLVVCLVVPSAAGAADPGIRLYLQPPASDAAGLTYTIASLAAVTATGTEHPLDLSLQSIGPGDTRRQRLLASGRLPAGSYSGFALTIRQAALKRERGEVALAVPDAAVRLDFPFAIAGLQGALFWLTLKPQESVTDGVRFSPAFSVLAPARPIAGHAGFVADAASSVVTVFDTRLLQAAALIETCAGPSGMALDPRRQRLFVACAKDEEIQAIDVMTGDVVERARLSPGDRPREVVLTSDGLTLLSVNAGSSSVTLFNAASLARLDRISVGNGPASAAVEPSGRRVFVFNTLSDSVSVIDITARGVVATVAVEPGPLRGQFSRRGDRLYVIHERSPYMTVLDPQQLAPVTRARLRSGAEAIVVDPARGLVCIGGSQDASVEFFDPNALMPLYSMRTRSGVAHLAVDAADNLLYMVSPDTRSLVVGRLADRKVITEIDIGGRPSWVAVMRGK